MQIVINHQAGVRCYSCHQQIPTGEYCEMYAPELVSNPQTGEPMRRVFKDCSSCAELDPLNGDPLPLDVDPENIYGSPSIRQSIEEDRR